MDSFLQGRESEADRMSSTAHTHLISRRQILSSWPPLSPGAQTQAATRTPHQTDREHWGAMLRHLWMACWFPTWTAGMGPIPPPLWGVLEAAWASLEAASPPPPPLRILPWRWVLGQTPPKMLFQLQWAEVWVVNAPPAPAQSVEKNQQITLIMWHFSSDAGKKFLGMKSWPVKHHKLLRICKQSWVQ